MIDRKEWWSYIKWRVKKIWQRMVKMSVLTN